MQVSACLEGARIDKRTYAGLSAAMAGAAPGTGSHTAPDAVYRCRPGDMKQKMW